MINYSFVLWQVCLKYTFYSGITLDHQTIFYFQLIAKSFYYTYIYIYIYIIYTCILCIHIYTCKHIYIYININR